MTGEYIGIAAVIFDRDGVLIEDTGFPHKPEHLRWMPGALAALRWLRERGIIALVATNQSGVARGYFAEADVEVFHRLMQEQVVTAGGRIDAFAVCPHLPDAAVSEYRVECDCRKPRPGLVRTLLQHFSLDPAKVLMIGDRDRDVQAGEAAGVRGFLYSGGDLLAFVQDAMARKARGEALRAPLHVAGLGMRRTAGITEARILHPLDEMRWLGDNHIVHGAGDLALPRGWPPGVMLLHRQFMTDPQFNARVDALASEGWAFVLEMDDDPRRWPQFVDSGFFAFRCVHGVSVSTPALAIDAREWNPEVRVFPNAIDRLPLAQAPTPEPGMPLRVFFGALNREDDWAPIVPALRAALQEGLGERLRLVVVHDRAFAQEFAPWVAESYGTLSLDDYRRCLATCHLALLPLSDTPFNRLKSDLKLIECCAHGAVPICSPVVYADAPAHREVAWFVDSPEEWVGALQNAVSQPDEWLRRRHAGRAYVTHERMQWQQAPARDHWYRSLLERQPRLEAARRERIAHYPLSAA